MKIISKLYAALLIFLVVGVGAFYAAVSLRKAENRHPAFYYWRTEWDGNPALLKHLRATHTRRIYLRLFDVRPDFSTGEPQPVAPVKILGEFPRNIEAVPVIYITNSVFFNPSAPIDELGDKVWLKLQTFMNANKLDFHEVQIDCDWTDQTRARYFKLLNRIKERARLGHANVSATIRLHQVKYLHRTGVPPVDRGMLMFYNFGRIEAERDGSSIFNASDAKKYSRFIASYPLPLDLSLPLFSWAIHSRSGQVQGLLEKLNLGQALKTGFFLQESSTRLRAQSAFFFAGKRFAPGDLLAFEETRSSDIRLAAHVARDGMGWKKQFGTIAFFDLDERNFASYEESDIENVLANF